MTRARPEIPAYTLRAFLKDDLASLAIMLAALVCAIFMLAIIGVSMPAAFAVIAFLACCITIAEAIRFLRRRSFYNELAQLLRNIESASYFCGLAPDANFLEGRIDRAQGELLGALAADEMDEMTHDAQAYRQYIELWVHETKTPLASMRLMLSNDSGEADSKLMAELERVEAQVEQALYYARSTSVHGDYSIREVDLRNVCAEACKRQSSFLMAHGTLPVFDIAQGETVLADEPWLIFMLGQIIGNAAKYGAHTITFSCVTEEPNTPRGRTVLTIADDGCGIPAKDVTRVFERGFTGAVGRTSGTATGMGLYLVANLCRSLGLHVSLASEEGVGTRVMISFPHDRRRLT